ncbi:hypothetical protein BN903_150 [Halorubrum sp. AJ67]|nr:hypothetical protein BN903_150 [Halorubrum sp. AJ67]
MSGLADGQPVPANTFGCQGLQLLLRVRSINLLSRYRVSLPPTTEVVGFRPCTGVIRTAEKRASSPGKCPGRPR